VGGQGRGPLFSPDGAHVAYVAGDSASGRVVLDGREGQVHTGGMPSDIAWSPMGNRLAYRAAAPGRGMLVVLDGKPGKRYDGVFTGTLTFSPDGKHIAYIARRGKKQFVVVDETEGRAFDWISSKDAGVVFDSPSSFHYIAGDGLNVLLVEETLK